MISKRVIIPVAAVAAIGAGLCGISQVSAASSNTGQKTLVQEIADTFGIDKSKVQAVFDKHKTEVQQDREVHYTDRLNQAVKDGKITSEQKDQILAEHNKLQAELKTAEGKTGADRRTAMQQVRQDAQTWAKQNNIDAKWLLGGGALRGGHMMGGAGQDGPGMMGPRGHHNDADDTPASPSPATPAPTASPSSSSS